MVAIVERAQRRGIADRVLTLVWSEFGRRPEENGSVGTDHGAGGVAMLLGTRVRGGQLGAFPGLASLDADGNLDLNNAKNQAAMMRYVNNAIMTPNAAHRTIWGSDTRLAAFWHL